MKKLMILGAGIYQVPLIKTAKKMGIYTIAVSIRGNYPGFSIADKVYYEDTTDFETVTRIARKEKIDGIVTAGTDVAVITIGKVCDELGLCGLSAEAARIASNKMLMKTKYEELSVRTARFRKVSFSNEEIVKACGELRFPLIFKAVDTSGSRGIVVVPTPDDINGASDVVKSATKLDYFIIEEFITGTEFGAQAFVLDNKVQFCLPHGDFVYKGDTGVPIGHFAPYELSDDIIEDTKLQLSNAVKAMGLNNCAVNADFILDENNKVYVLELGGRSGATCLAELVSIYYGFDYYEKIIRASLGEKVSFESNEENPNSSHLIMSDKTGVIEKQEYNGTDERVVEVQFDYNIGDSVRRFNIGPDRIGHIITVGKTLDEANAVLENAMNSIELSIKE